MDKGEWDQNSCRNTTRISTSVGHRRHDKQGDIALQVLPILLPASVYKDGKKLVRPSFEERRKAFIDIQPVGSNMVEYLRHAKDTRELPYVLMLGDCSCCSQAFVIISGEALEQSTLLGAVDVCFKAFYVFDLQYPKQCAPVWQFLQTVVYELPGQESPAIRLLSFSNKNNYSAQIFALMAQLKTRDEQIEQVTKMALNRVDRLSTENLKPDKGYVRLRKEVQKLIKDHDELEKEMLKKEGLIKKLKKTYKEAEYRAKQVESMSNELRSKNLEVMDRYKRMMMQKMGLQHDELLVRLVESAMEREEKVLDTVPIVVMRKKRLLQELKQQ
ncbi:uncharacterized protein [Hoplias malabaricus]|uniref:uncharacterized protein isoform X1 n=1 Tax=Hoplias malabaricus TaxID=27720 RepID=UPI0034633D54